MKKIILSLATIVLIALIGYTQGKKRNEINQEIGKESEQNIGKKEAATVEENVNDDDMDYDDEHAKHSKTHVKKKEELKDSEFGEKRFEEAKTAAKSKKADMLEQIKEYKILISSNEDRIKDARAKIKSQLAAGKITMAEEKEKTDKVNLAEMKVKEMKGILDAERKQLEEFEMVMGNEEMKE